MCKMYRRMLLCEVVAFVLLVITSCSSTMISSEECLGGLSLVEEECRIIDYTIDGDTIRFRYMLRFENRSRYDCKVGEFDAEFQEDDMTGWLKPREVNFVGYETKDKYQTIRAGDTTDLIVTYEGTYLGGEVNMNLRPSKFFSFYYWEVDWME